MSVSLLAGHRLLAASGADRDPPFYAF